jgi:hypothetical protein
MRLRKRIERLTRELKPKTASLREQRPDPEIVARLVEALTGSRESVDVLEILRGKAGGIHD